MQRGGGGGVAASCEVRGRGGCGARGGGAEHGGRELCAFPLFVHTSLHSPSICYLPAL